MLEDFQRLKTPKYKVNHRNLKLKIQQLEQPEQQNSPQSDKNSLDFKKAALEFERQ